MNAARACGDTFIETGMTGLVLFAGVLGPTPFAEALTDAEAVLAESRKRGNRRLEADALRVIGGCAAHLADFARSREAAAASQVIYDELGATIDFWAGHQALARFALLEGRDEDAIELLREAEEHLESLGETAFRSTIAGMLAVMHAEGGAVDDAARYLEIAERTAGSDDRASQVAIVLGRALIAELRGDPGAVASFEHAIELDDQSDSFVTQAATRLTVARALAVSRPEGAARVATEARDRAARKGAVVLERRAEELLARLGVSGA
jgi:hypothetical protein